MKKIFIAILVAVSLVLIPMAVIADCNCRCIDVDCGAYREQQNTPVEMTAVHKGVEIGYSYIPAEEHPSHAKWQAIGDAVHIANQNVIDMVINSHSAGRHIGLRGNKLLEYMMPRINKARAENPLSGI